MDANCLSCQSDRPLLTRLRQSTLALSTLLCLAVTLPSCSNSTPIAQTTTPATTPAATPSPVPSASTPAAMSPSPAASPGAANKTEETKAIEASIISTLSPQLSSPITAANCPNLEKLEAGKTFDCDLTVAEGSFLGTVTLKDANGGFSVNTKNVLVMPALEKQLVEAIKKENQLDVKVDCGSAKVKVFKDVGESFDCKLTQSNGKSGTATATVTTPAGGVDTKWKIEQ